LMKKMEMVIPYNCSIYSIGLILMEVMTGECIKGINNSENKDLKFILFIFHEKILNKYGIAWAKLAKLILKPSEKSRIYKVNELIKHENLNQALHWDEKVKKFEESISININSNLLIYLDTKFSRRFKV
jgi:hypothetical protein